MNQISISLAETDADIAGCFPVMSQLRPQLQAGEFVARIRRKAAESYRLAFLRDENGQVRSVAGFRFMDRLHAGLVLYVDDLVTDGAARSRGHGDRLFDWLVAHARSAGCNALTLDSGTHRLDAHRFYLRKRCGSSVFILTCRCRTYCQQPIVRKRDCQRRIARHFRATCPRPPLPTTTRFTASRFSRR
jgi:GNAT superfamily N-acetyltransferase